MRKQKIPRLKVIEFLDIPIGSPRAPRAQNMTLFFLRSGLNDGMGLDRMTGWKKVKRKRE